MNLPIETVDLGKRYGKVTAVKHLSLRVAEGEIYAFLGLNGAGKTTTIRMLLGMIKPTWGSAQVLDTRVRLGSRKPWASVGYLVETPHSYQELTVLENLEVARRLPAAVEQVNQAQLALGAIEDVILLDAHHRQPAPLGSHAVVMPRQLLLVLQVRYARGAPLLPRNDGGMWDVVLCHGADSSLVNALSCEAAARPFLST